MATAPWVARTALHRDVDVAYRPILDLARGVVAGYQAVADATGAGGVRRQVAVVSATLAALPALPSDTFLTLPLSMGDDGLEGDVDGTLMAVLLERGDLAGVVLDLCDVPTEVGPTAASRLATLRDAGALVALGGEDAPQPTLRHVTRLRPSIIRLGQAWVDGIGDSAEKRDAIAATGSMAAQLDAWVLAEGVRTPAELRTLSELGVPLAQGPLVGGARGFWQDADPRAQEALPGDRAAGSGGVLRALLRPAYTATDLDTARAILPETTGYDVVVVLGADARPAALLVKGADRWEHGEPLAVHVDTPLPDALTRAMARPREGRFHPLVCTDAAGRLLGVLHLEDLVTHLARPA
jgi:EAL domain-containing protein (putative c-di-GMP-specific phosphodiesterase class I)